MMMVLTWARLPPHMHVESPEQHDVTWPQHLNPSRVHTHDDVHDEVRLFLWGLVGDVEA